MRDTTDVWARVTELLDALPDDVVVCSTGGRILHANPTARDRLGETSVLVARFVETPAAPSGAAPAPLHLTPTEDAVARMLAERWTNREIARALGISVRTVQHHVLHIMAKLDVRSRRDVGPALAALRRPHAGCA